MVVIVMFNFQPKDQDYWSVVHKNSLQLRKNIEIEVAIIGGGMAGLSAAQAFANKGKKVALFEQYYCGSGATGKSSGFVTPNTELSFSDIAQETNLETAQKFWSFISSGVANIRNNIQDHEFSCDFKEDASFLVSNCKKTAKNIITEYEYLEKSHIPSRFFDANNLQQKINSKAYLNGISYDDSFTIHPLKYCQELKKHLQNQGVLIYEESPIISIDNHILKTPLATITADYIIVCVDKYLPQLNKIADSIYHAQTFVLASEQITNETIRKIFPEKNYAVCDSELIYNYYRPTADNRILLGGGNVWSTYSSQEKHNYKGIYNKLTHYFKKTFPDVTINFEYQWPGLIGISKDLLPVAGKDTKHPHIYYISAATGLSTAAALGVYSQESLLDGRDDFNEHFNPYRTHILNTIFQKTVGKKLSFAVNNFLVQKNLGCF